MLFRSLASFLFLILFSFPLYAAECLDIFPALSQNYGPQLNLPSFKYSSENDGDREGGNLAIYGGQYKDVKVDSNGSVYFAELNTEYRLKKLELGQGAIAQFVAGDYWIEDFKFEKDSTLTVNGGGTVRIYVGAASFEKNAHINDANGLLIFISYSDFSAAKELNFTGVMYAQNNIALSKDATIIGSITGGGVSLGDTLSETYQETSITNADFNAMCETTPVLRCDADSAFPVIFTDSFSSAKAWSAINFNRNVSNWPSDNRFPNSSSEEQDVVFSISSELNIAGNAQSGGHNEYGMVGYDLATDSIDSSSAANYSIYGGVSADNIGLNNDVGIVFSYQDDENYYLARWGKYGTNYYSDSSFPGEYRRFELIKMVAGTATQLDSVDSINLGSNLSMKVVVQGDGVAVCTGDSSGNNMTLRLSSTEKPPLKQFGFFTYDNDDGISIDDVEVSCNDCTALDVTPIANYRFDECAYTGIAADTIDQMANYAATSHNSMASTSVGVVERAADITNHEQHFTTSIALPADFTISTWFKKPTSTTGSDYFVLGAMEGGGDLLVLDRNNSWRWGIYNGSNTLFGSYSFETEIQDNNWHHMVLMYQSGISYLVIDGIWVDTINIAPSGTLKYIGTSFDSIGTSDAQGFRAPIDEFMVFNQTLTLSEMQTIYNNQLAAKNYDGSTRTEVSCSATLIAKYSLEETSWSGSNTILDSSGYNNHASSSGNLVSTLDNLISCQAAEIPYNNNLSDRDAISTGVNANTLGDKGSLAFWYRSNSNWDDIAEAKVLFDASTSSDAQFLMYIWPGGYLEFEATEPNGDRAERYIKKSFSANEWVHIALTWDATNDSVKIYLNGVSQSLTDYTGKSLLDGLHPSMGTLYFGDNNSTSASVLGGSADGAIDEIHLYQNVLTVDEISAIYADVTECSTPVIDHYLIEHNGQGLTCETERVAVRACTNVYDGSTCVESSEPISLDLVATGGANSVSTTTAFVGSTIVEFNYTVAETIVLSTANESIGASNTTVCNDNSSDSCNMVFANAGFRFLNGSSGTSEIIANQIAGTSFPIRVQAVEYSNGVCIGVFTGDVDISLSQQNVNPGGTSGQSFQVGGVNLAKYPSFTSNVTLNFGTDSIATLPSARYLDAGNIGLHASYADSDISLVGSSEPFWVRPNNFAISAQSSGRDLDGDSAISSRTHEAGASFDFTVTAYNSLGSASNNITENYQQGQIQLKLSRILPNLPDSIDGDFTYASGSTLTIDSSVLFQNTGLTAFNTGKSVFSQAQFSEVGIINIDVQDINYGGQNWFVESDDITVGRFRPDHFEQTIVESGSLMSSCNLGATTFAYSGQLDEAALALGIPDQGTIEYLIQPIIAITAYNANGGVTENYYQDSDGSNNDFMKLDNNDISVISAIADNNARGIDTTLLSLSGTISTGELSQDDFTTNAPLARGTVHYKLSDSDYFYYLRSANTQVQNFQAEFDLTVSSISDGEASATVLNNIESLTGVDIRFGRMVVENSYGPETSDLLQVFKTEYYDGSKFVLNTDDKCTTYDDSKVSLSNISIVPTSVFGGSGSFSEGISRELSITAPGTGNIGEMGVTYSSFDWLQFDWDISDTDTRPNQNPTAVATFGVFRGNDRIISWREVGN